MHDVTRDVFKHKIADLEETITYTKHAIERHERLLLECKITLTTTETEYHQLLEDLNRISIP